MLVMAPLRMLLLLLLKGGELCCTAYIKVGASLMAATA